jgi:L-histidine Nalpha-methyltransferase
MARYSAAYDVERLASLEAHRALIDEVKNGFLRRPRSLAPWMFYDAAGSRLFERITELPEYYLTRTERDIFAKFAPAIIAAAGHGKAHSLRLVELGAGTAAKTGILLKAASSMFEEVVYMPVDVSPDALELARQSIKETLPAVRVQPVVRNYVNHPLKLEAFHGPTLGLYIGASIGNFSPKEARMILRNMSSQLRAGDSFLLGVDMVKERAPLLAAYDDAAGVTAEFNLNILRRLNRELGADFDLSGFRHLALWNPFESRIEMHLESKRPQNVYVPAAQVDAHFAKWETIHTENSYKFTDESVGKLLGDTGFDIKQTWKDERRWFSVALAQPRELVSSHHFVSQK